MARANLAVLLLLFALFGLSCISFVFMVSAFFTKARSGGLFGLIGFIVASIPFTLLQLSGFPPAAKVLLCVLPQTAFALAVQVVVGAEALVRDAPCRQPFSQSPILVCDERRGLRADSWTRASSLLFAAVESAGTRGHPVVQFE